MKEDERVQLQVRVGIVFGGGGRLFSHLTVAENLSLPWCYHRNCAPEAVQERLDAILDATGLASFQNNTPATIDRTLRLRTALARALMLSPEILFLDNPLAGTGPRELHWWLEFLDKLRSGHPILGNQSLTVVVSTASLEHWSERGDRFGLVQGRQFIPLGSRVELARQSERVLQELLPSGKLGE